MSPLSDTGAMERTVSMPRSACNAATTDSKRHAKRAAPYGTKSLHSFLRGLHDQLVLRQGNLAGWRARLHHLGYAAWPDSRRDRYFSPSARQSPGQRRDRGTATAPRRSTGRGFCESAWCGGSRRASRGGRAGVVVQRTKKKTQPPAAGRIHRDGRVIHVSHGARGGTAPAESRRAR